MISAARQVVVTGAFDDIRSRHLRFLEEAAGLGELTVLLWPDEAVQELMGRPPKFPGAERLYFLNAVRYVSRVRLAGGPIYPATLPETPDFRPDVWAVDGNQSSPDKQANALARGVEYRVISDEQMRGFPDPTRNADVTGQTTAAGRKKVVVTGSYDWLHSGHVRFFEEVSAYGELYVVVGHDANIRLLKGEGHPLFPQDERRYLVGSIKHVKQALISSGDGWLDAEPEIRRLKPDIYAVNEDGDLGGKREYCEKNGIEYLVLKRAPAPGLPARTSTSLRGF
jgi:cytidyltransferase-like protein